MVLRLQVSVGNLILELSTRCVRKRGVETQMRARITRVIKVSEWHPSAQRPAYDVVLVLCRALARHVDKSWTKEQRSQPKRSCNLDQQRKATDPLTVRTKVFIRLRTEFFLKTGAYVLVSFKQRGGFDPPIAQTKGPVERKSSSHFQLDLSFCGTVRAFPRILPHFWRTALGAF